MTRRGTISPVVGPANANSGRDGTTASWQSAVSGAISPSNSMNVIHQRCTISNGARDGTPATGNHDAVLTIFFSRYAKA